MCQALFKPWGYSGIHTDTVLFPWSVHSTRDENSPHTNSEHKMRTRWQEKYTQLIWLGMSVGGVRATQLWGQGMVDQGGHIQGDTCVTRSISNKATLRGVSSGENGEIRSERSAKSKPYRTLGHDEIFKAYHKNNGKLLEVSVPMIWVLKDHSGGWIWWNSRGYEKSN